MRKQAPPCTVCKKCIKAFLGTPHIVGQALKGAVFTAAMLERIGMNTYPTWDAKRTDLIQSVQFDDAEQMIAFCQAIQFASPVNSHFTPYPNYMPGYEDDVIMAAGTFVQGASIELSAELLDSASICCIRPRGTNVLTCQNRCLHGD